ncbi:MAG: NapC/NirT family cytochrome c [Candidatus Eremiobacterota bacterium]
MKFEWNIKKYKIIIFAGLICIIILIYPAVEMTSTPSFCSTCHEIKPAVESWKVSDHGIVDGKARATCRDCHIPSWKNPASVIINKSTHGIKDTYHHFFSKEDIGKEDFYFAIKHRAIKSMPDERCISCHKDIYDREKDIIESETGIIKGLHTEKEVKKLSCLICHKHSGHLPFY